MPSFHDYITDFIFTEDLPQNADIIFIPGGAYGEIAVNAAKLYHDGYAAQILVSGKYSILSGSFEGAISPSEYTDITFSDECSFLSRILTDHGVPQTAILQESDSTYTYENAIKARTLTDSLSLDIKVAILSCQAYHAKRCLLYYQLLYPDTHFLVCPVVTRGVSRFNWFQNPDKIDLVLGEVARCGTQFHDILKSY